MGAVASLVLVSLVVLVEFGGGNAHASELNGVLAHLLAGFIHLY